MTRIAIFPGSFDPITLGHESIVKRALPLFDKIIVAVGINSAKQYLSPITQRITWLEQTFKDNPKIEITTYEGLTVDFCKSKNAHYILRGIRSTMDYQFEKSIAQMNFALNSNIETVFLMTEPKYSAISSTIIRDIIKNNGDVSPFLPSAIKI